MAFENKGAMAATIVVAASDSLNKAAANYVCDGVADNVEIQAAIDALPAGGGKVMLLEGTYNIAVCIQLTKDTEVVGQGWASKLVLNNGVDDAVFEHISGGAESGGLRIADLSIDANKAGQPGISGEAFAIILRRIDHARVENVYVKNALRAAIYVSSSDYGYFVGNFLEGCDGEGIYMDSGHQQRIIGNRMINVSTGISLRQSGGCLIVGNDVHTPTDYGINTDGGCTRNSIIGGHVRSPGSHGLYLRGEDETVVGVAIYQAGAGLASVDGIYLEARHTISGCLILDSGRSGIYSHGRGDILSDNEIIGSGLYGIHLSGSEHIVIGNYIERSYRHGIYGQAYECIIDGCVIKNSSQQTIGSYTGIDIFNVYDYQISNCHIFDDQNAISSLLTSDAASGQPDVIVADASLFFEGQWVTISDLTPDTENNQILSINTTTNTLTMVNNLANDYTVAQSAVVTGRKTQGYGIYSYASDYNIITNNKCVGNITAGIYIFRSDYCVVSGNDCSSQVSGDGINVTGDGTGQSNYNNIFGNTCRSNGDDGIEVVGGANANYNAVKGNVCTGNSGSQIADAGASTVVRSNVGYLTENSGTATVLNTTTSIAVAHGLAATPTRIQITPRENPTNAVSYWWVDTVGAANFTINVNADPGASNLDFDWHAQVGEG